MTQAELFQALKTLGMPVAYGEFTQPTAPPFIVYQHAYSIGFNADNKNSLDVGNFQVELYTKYKDPDKEKLIQDKLNDIELPYTKREFYIESENLRQIIYEIQLIGG